MLRLLSVATLLLLVACLIISASIALADIPTAATPSASGLAPAGADGRTAVDIYEFDFAIETQTLPNPEFDEFITPQEI